MWVEYGRGQLAAVCLWYRGRLLVFLFQDSPDDGGSCETFGFGFLIDHTHKRSGKLDNHDMIMTLPANGLQGWFCSG